MLRWIKERKFKSLVEENISSLVQFAYVRCHDKSLAEDLVQEAFIKAYKAFMEKGEEIVRPKEWLYKILINTHISYVRKKQIQINEDADLNNLEISSNEESFDGSVSL